MPATQAAPTHATVPTRERILNAALELFAAQGFDATSTAQIERAAGLSPRSGALYKHFRSKEELLEVALAQRMQEIKSLPDRLDLGPLSDLRSELTLIARWGLSELARERELALIVMKEGHRLPAFRDAFREAIVRPGHALATEVLRRYSASHDVEFDDIDALGEVLCSALVGFALQGFIVGRDFVDISDERFAAAHVEVALALVEQNEKEEEMNDGTLTRYRFEARFTLIQLGVIQGVLGFYALFFPRSFYEDFPLGLNWVELLPAYNEHLVTDFGGLFLATSVMLLAASVRLERRWVVITLVAFLAFSLPHTIWHMFNLDVYSTGNAIANVVTLAATVLLPIGVLFLVAKESRSPRKPGPAEPGSNGLRIEGVPDSTRNPLTRASFAVSRRRYGDVVDPMRVYAHNPTVMTGYTMHELAAERATKVPERLKHLAAMRAAMVAGCEWCLDFGSFLSKGHGVSQDEMRELPHYRDSGAFDETEKLVMDFATGMSRSPVDVPDELFAQLRERFDEAQLVELADIAALENYRARFNWAFGLEGQGFSEGAFCVPPEAREAAI